jgi:hypothetical protein
VAAGICPLSWTETPTNVVKWPKQRSLFKALVVFNNDRSFYGRFRKFSCHIAANLRKQSLKHREKSAGQVKTNLSPQTLAPPATPLKCNNRELRQKLVLVVTATFFWSF